MRRGVPCRSAVRIIAGRWKGRRLDVPTSARPTSGRAREALFDLLGERVAGARVLDLYAGSGAVGLEAVSRGASRVVLVDHDTTAIKGACRMLRAQDLVVIRTGEIEMEARQLRDAGETFEIVFLDPPYAGSALSAESLSTIASLVTRGGILVVQCDAGKSAPAVDGFELRQRRAYGRNVFHFFERTADARARTT